METLRWEQARKLRRVLLATWLVILLVRTALTFGVNPVGVLAVILDSALNALGMPTSAQQSAALSRSDAGNLLVRAFEVVFSGLLVGWIVAGVRERSLRKKAEAVAENG
jgi:hypothetical protein